MTRPCRLTIIPALILLVLLTGASVASAQPVLRQATPAPDSVLPGSPESITLLFDTLLADRGTSIRVLNAAGERVDNQDALVNPANRFEVSVTLPPLIEGVYTIDYSATALGGSTLTTGQYTITIALPAPRLALLTPVDGQAFQAGDIPLEMAVDFFDFGLFANRIRVYVDGELREEVRALEYTIEGLSPGVHQIRVVLARLDDQELPDTQIVVHIAVAQHDEELQGRDEAALADPDAGLQLTSLQTTGLVILTVLLLLFGIWLGRQPAYPGE